MLEALPTYLPHMQASTKRVMSLETAAAELGGSLVRAELVRGQINTPEDRTKWRLFDVFKTLKQPLAGDLFWLAGV